jgi:hypothetical protein
MAGRYTGDIFDFSGMTDDELYDLVVQQLREHPEVDEGWIQVGVKDGHVTLSGRVGSDSEVSVAEQVITEILGIEAFTNELVVDELHRGETSEAADDAVMEDLEVDSQYGREQREPVRHGRAPGGRPGGADVRHPQRDRGRERRSLVRSPRPPHGRGLRLAREPLRGRSA